MSIDKIFETNEFAVARRLINISLAYSAEAFSRMTNVPVMLDAIEWETSMLNDSFKLHTPCQTELFTLQSPIKGEMHGSSYLLFSPDNAQKLWEVCLSGLDAEQQLKLREPILLEVDNILTASAVTHFSNFFNKRMYGDVPIIHKLNCEQTQNLIIENTSKLDIIISFKTIFRSKNEEFAPEFIWVFEQAFAEHIKLLSANPNTNDILTDHETYVKKYFLTR